MLTAIANYFPTLPPNFRLLLTSQHRHISKDIMQLMPDCIIKEITFNDEGIKADYSEHVLQTICHLLSKKLKLAEKYTVFTFALVLNFTSALPAAATVKYLCNQFIARSMGTYFWISTAL